MENKYEVGSFGYWWTVEQGYKDIADKDYNGTIDIGSLSLTSLKGSPKSVSGNFFCDNNKLTSLEGAPKSIGGGFFCNNNKVKFTQDEVKATIKVNGKIIV